jgi:hypothetical protein
LLVRHVQRPIVSRLRVHLRNVRDGRAGMQACARQSDQRRALRAVIRVGVHEWENGAVCRSRAIVCCVVAISCSPAFSCANAAATLEKCRGCSLPSRLRSRWRACTTTMGSSRSA